MLQDLKVGHILGGTPWKMQVGDFIGVVVSGALMFFPLYILHVSNIKLGGIGFGDRALSAPQAGLMATLAQGIVGGEMAWPLVIVGIAHGDLADPDQGQEPDALLGRHVPAARDDVRHLRRRHHSGLRRSPVVKQRATTRPRRLGSRTPACWRVGLIAGEALMGLVVAAVVFFRDQLLDEFVDGRLRSPLAIPCSPSSWRPTWSSFRFRRLVRLTSPPRRRR